MRWRPTNIRKLLDDRLRVARRRETPTEVEPSRAGLPVAPVVVPRWIQLVLLPLAILGLWELARAIGPVVLILTFASVTALILNQPIKALERRRIPRPLAIPLMYIAVFAAFALLGLLLSNPITSQVSHFQHNIPSIVRNANRDLGDLQTWLDHRGIHIHIEKQGQTALDTLEKSISKRSGDIVSFSSDLLQKVAEISFGLILSLVLSIYFLIYSASIGDLVRRVMPRGDGTRADDYPYRVQRAVLGYVRGQLTFSLLMGASTGVALWIFGVIGIFPDGRQYAVFFGVFYALMEFIPYLGPFLGALPPVIVALLDHPITAVWLIILFVVLQELEGHIVAPQVFRISLRINPILIILALLIGDELYGIGGALLALPVSAVLRETVLYLRRHLVLEPWGTAAPGAVGAVGAGSGAGGVAGPPDHCPDCEALAGPGDAFCRSCGSSLEPRVGTPG
jgi:predicted PurR-regulated permease PerM